MRYLYSLLFYLLIPFILLRLLWRSRKDPAYRQRIAERFGFCPYSLKDTIWVHTVSVGETVAAIPLIKALKKAYPTHPLLVTNMTVTGAARVKALLGGEVLQAYLPYDLPDAVHRFLSRIQPKVAVIVETELWPNLFAACQKRSIPLVITNARLSAASARGYHWVAPLTRKLFSAVSTVAAQSEADAKRFMDLGLPAEKIVVTGNLKYDIEIPDTLYAQAEKLRQRLRKNFIWIAASTHEGEEAMAWAAHQQIRQHYPDALLILVPRHPDRFDAVAQWFERQQIKVVRRSQDDGSLPIEAIYLGDTMGELLLLYAVSEVVFVGGSLVAVGGHNLLEPAALSKPLLSGPYLFNFSDISQQLLAVKALQIVHNAEALSQRVQALFADVADQKQRGMQARAILNQNRGAWERQLQCILEVM